MATTLASGSSANITVAEGDFVEVNNASTARARVEFAGKIINDQHRGRVKYGPFSAGTVRVGSITGALTYDSGKSPDTSESGGFDTGFSITELVNVQALTATDTAVTGACDYAGFHVRAIDGTPQTVTVYDATSATGTPIHTESVTATGYYAWSGNKVRRNSTGCHVVISGGTSRTIDVLAG